MGKASGEFSFLKHDSIGANAAEDDVHFLPNCFIDTGDIKVLLTFDDARSIALGRTGSGKTALLQRAAKRHANAIEINPESLSFNYIANSTIIRFFTDLGLNLDPFFKLLWRHIIAVEIIQRRFPGDTDDSRQNRFRQWFQSDQVKAKHKQSIEQRKKALDYLKRFGDSFWKDTEYRTKEYVNKLENELTKGTDARFGGTLGSEATGISLSTDIATNRSKIQKMSVEEKGELIERGRAVVNSVQIRELAEIIALINDIMADYNNTFVVTIDKLDDAWVDDTIRFRLIRSLIDTAREFRKVEKVKLLIGLRRDLLERVLNNLRDEDTGFQEEKFRSLYLPVSWSEQNLRKLIDLRIGQLVKDRHDIKNVVNTRDILPPTLNHDGKDIESFDYILRRTWMRPRDVIEFFNGCIDQAYGKHKLKATMIYAAEKAYSSARLRSLIEEWRVIFPNLAWLLQILQQKPSTFRLGTLSDSTIADLCLGFVAENPLAEGPIPSLTLQVVNELCSPAMFRSSMIHILYRVGACGLKTDSFSATQWSSDISLNVSIAEVTDAAMISVHPALWRALGIVPSSRART